jgi:hypothetical protein
VTQRRISSHSTSDGYVTDQKINSFSLVTGLRGKIFNKKDTKMAELNTGDGGGKKGGKVRSKKSNAKSRFNCYG